MSKYDVIIVGAGPAGLFASYELLKQDKKKKILLIDKGKRVEKRKPNEVMCGIGGAGTFSDGKLTLTANLSHEKAFHLIAKGKYQKILDYVDGIFTDFGVNSPYYPKKTKDLEELIREATINDVELIVRKARHVGTDGLTAVILMMEKFLLEKGVEIKERTEIVDIVVKKGKVCGVKTKKRRDLLFRYCSLSPWKNQY